jgi:hypothetical protein
MISNICKKMANNPNLRIDVSRYINGKNINKLNTLGVEIDE